MEISGFILVDESVVAPCGGVATERFIEESMADGAYFDLVGIDAATIYPNMKFAKAAKEEAESSDFESLKIVKVKRTVVTELV